jgi:Fe-S-cluster-containing dehydrogenase component
MLLGEVEKTECAGVKMCMLGCQIESGHPENKQKETRGLVSRIWRMYGYPEGIV